jgi:hypothetical protein
MIYTGSGCQIIIPYVQCLCMRALLNLGSSKIELVRGGYKLGSLVNGAFVILRKLWLGPPFIARRGGGLVVYSLIILEL